MSSMLGVKNEPQSCVTDHECRQRAVALKKSFTAEIAEDAEGRPEKTTLKILEAAEDAAPAEKNGTRVRNPMPRSRLYLETVGPKVRHGERHASM